MRKVPGWLVLVPALVGSCSTESNHTTIPPEAAALQDYEKLGIQMTVPWLARVEARLPFLLNPGSPGAAGLVFIPNPDAGAPPNAYLFTIPIDDDNNGMAELTMDGEAVFNGDPTVPAPGFGGHLDFTLAAAGGLGDFTGGMDFLLNGAGEREVSGTGTFSESLTGNETVVSIAPSSPLTMRAAIGNASSQANACAYSLDGTAHVQVTGTGGVLNSDWIFSKTSRTIAVTGAAFTDEEGATVQLPNTTVTIPCGSSGSLADWNGTYLQDWACFPTEFGQATLTLARNGNGITITDEDPPGSGDLATYSATPVPGNPHVLRGFFTSGPPGNTYREDFSWTLAGNGQMFTQISYYVYQEGPNQGSGGICAGWAKRQ